MTLSTPDWLVVALVLGTFFALGASTRMRQSNVFQMLAAGRNLSLPLFVATLVSTWYGGILGVGEMFDAYGWSTWLAIGLPYYVFGLLFAFILAKRVRDAEQISIPERLTRCYGRLAGVLSAVLVLVLAVPAAHVFMIGRLTDSIAGGVLGAYGGIAAAAAIGFVALYRGGLLADARANIVAFVMMYVSFVVIVCASLINPPVAFNLPSSHTRFDAGNGIMFLVGWFVLGSWTLVDPGFHQRVTAARTVEISRRGIIASVCLWFLFDGLTITTSHYAYRALGPGQGSELFIKYGDLALPNGLRGVFYVGMFGVILSAFVGYTLAAAGTFGRDLFARMLDIQAESTTLRATRVGLVVAIAVAVVLAMAFQSVIFIWFDLGGMVVPGLLVATLPAFLRPSLLSPSLCTLGLVLPTVAAAGWWWCSKHDLLQCLGEYGKLHHIFAGLAVGAVIFVLGAVRHKIGGTHERRNSG